MSQSVEQVEFAKGISNFAGTLYSKCAAKADGNVIISPFSVASVLAVLLQGADGNTLHQIQQALGLSGDKATIANQFEQYFETLGVKDNRVKSLLIANRLYVQQGHQIKQSLKDTVVKKFNFDITNINFAQSVESANTINAFVESKTNNRIKDLIKSDALNEDTRLVGVNAVYFKDDWKQKFKKDQTFKGDFYLNDTNKVEVDFMHINEDFRYAELDDLDASAVELEYNNSDLAFVVLLPNSRNGLPELETKLKSYDFTKIADALYKTKVDLTLPKFKVDFELSLNDVLKELGMTDMFTQAANFNSMLDSTEPLHVSEVVHKAFIEITEDGAEAAAATGFIMMARSMPFYNRFRADHAFLYHILDTKSKSIIFSGRFTKN